MASSDKRSDTDHPDDPQAVDASASAGSDAERADAPAVDERRVAYRPAPRPRGGTGLAALALIIALLALGTGAWLWYESEQAAGPGPDPDLEALKERIGELDRGLADLRREMDGLESLDALEGLDERVRVLDATGREDRNAMSALDARMEERIGRQAETLGERIDDLSEEVGTLSSRLAQAVDELDERGDLERRVDRDLERRMLMLEAAGLLRIGQERATLADDIDGAALAFRRAAARLADIDDVRLDRVRRVLARELDVLEAIRQPDLDRELARLDRLRRDSRDWPTRIDGPGPAPVELETGSESEAGWRQRLGRSLRGLVSVQSRDGVGRTGEQYQAAREQLQLHLAAAQLALTRRDSEALALHLEAAVDLLDEWFDSAAPAVAEGRGEFEALAAIRLTLPEPDLGEALNLLQARLEES